MGILSPDNNQLQTINSSSTFHGDRNLAGSHKEREGGFHYEGPSRRRGAVLTKELQSLRLRILSHDSQTRDVVYLDKTL